MDEGDRGQVAYDGFLKDALAATRRRLPAGPGSIVCVDCGDEIPAGRRDAYPGCIRCVDCETIAERG